MTSAHPVELLKCQLSASIACIERDRLSRPDKSLLHDKLLDSLVEMLRKLRQGPFFDAGLNTQGALSDLRYMRGLELRLPFPKTTLYFTNGSGPCCVLAEEMSPVDAHSFMRQRKLECDTLFDDGAVLVRGFIQSHASGAWRPVEIGLIVSRHWITRNERSHTCSALEINAIPFHALPLPAAVKTDELISAYTLFGGLLEFCEALATEDLRTDRVERKRLVPMLPSSLKRDGEAKKTRKWRSTAPAENKIIRLGAPRYTRMPTERPGLRSSPCEHYRRGHLRRIGRKNIIWVNACLVGHRDGSLKTVPRKKKDYIIQKSM